MKIPEKSETEAEPAEDLPATSEAPAAQCHIWQGGDRRAAGGELAAVLATLTEPAIVIGEDHRILAANRSCTSLFTAPEEVLGRRCHEVFHHRPTPCDDARERCPARRFRDTGEPCRVVHVHHTPDGEEHHEVVIYPLVGDEGELTPALQILRPVAVASPRPNRDRLVGRSLVFNRMLELVLRVAPEETPVLLLGETGTGREQVAKAIHRLSPRRDGAFVPVDCSSLSEVSFGRELFAGEPIPSPGAPQPAATLGTARGGSLFLDEVGELPLPRQGELLRLLKSRAHRPGGLTVPGAWELRLLCSAQPDLVERVAAGSFLDDLYYRISAFPIRLPPLRERAEDLPLLARWVLRQIGCRSHLHPASLAALEGYPFPGNLRELRRVLEHACVQADGGTILPRHLPPECCGARGESRAAQEPAG